METPSSKRITRSQALAATNNSNSNIHMSKGNTEKRVLKSIKRTRQDQSAFFDITNDSPVIGLSSKTNGTPGSGEALLRGQVKTLLQKVEKEDVILKYLVDDDVKGPFYNLKNLVNSPMGLLAPTPNNTPHVLNLSANGSAQNNGLESVTSSSLSCLPEDILVQIVARISCIKTILRCTSVCKSWYSFITSTQFVQFHDNNVNIHDKRLLLCEYSAYKYYCFSVHDDSEDFQKYYSNMRKRVLEAWACNGLICYASRYGDPHSLYLWNPVIRKVKKLPDLNNNVSNIDDELLFKLWFDSNANDYKIIRRIAYTNTTNAAVSVHVYNLNTNSWKLITEDVRVSTDGIDKFVYINGTLYWPAQKDQEWIIVSLDTKSWMFRETATSFKGRYLCLTPSHHDDSLVIYEYHCEEVDFLVNPYGAHQLAYDVYKYTTDELYSVNIGKDGRIDVDLPLFVGQHYYNNNYEEAAVSPEPLGVRHNDEHLFRHPNSLRIFSYNLKTKKLTDFDSTRLLCRVEQIPLKTTFLFIFSKSWILNRSVFVFLFPWRRDNS